MKIISKYRDYYDSIAHIYGGGDPKIRYERDKYNSRSYVLGENDRPTFGRWKIKNRYSLEFLVIGDRFYTLYCDMEEKPVPKTWSVLTKDSALIKKLDNWDRKYYDEFCEVGLGGDRLNNLTRLVGNPVYIVRRAERVNGTNSVRFDVQDYYTPLHTFGIHKLVPAEQMYQNLSYYLSNVMNGSPDVMPVGKPPQTDKEKILSHGLDLKYSFRKRP